MTHKMKYTPISEMTRIAGYFTETLGKTAEYPSHLTVRFTWRVSDTLHVVLNLSYDPEAEFFSIVIAIAETESILFHLKCKPENYRDGFHQFLSDIIADILNKYR